MHCNLFLDKTAGTLSQMLIEPLQQYLKPGKLHVVEFITCPKLIYL